MKMCWLEPEHVMKEATFHHACALHVSYSHVYLRMKEGAMQKDSWQV